MAMYDGCGCGGWLARRSVRLVWGGGVHFPPILFLQPTLTHCLHSISHTLRNLWGYNEGYLRHSGFIGQAVVMHVQCLLTLASCACSKRLPL